VSTAGLEIREYSIPFKHKLITSSREYSSRSGYHICLQLADTPGLGEAAPLPGFNQDTPAECLESLQLFDSRLKDPGNWDNPAGLIRLAHECTHASPAACFGLETAILDSAARKCKIPLNQYLNKKASLFQYFENGENNIPLINVNALYHQDLPVPEGIKCLKVKLVSDSKNDDLRLLDRITAEYGHDLLLRLDFNGKYDFDAALKILPEFQKYNIDYFEQPVDNIDLAGLLELQKAANHSIALDNFPDYLSLLDEVARGQAFGPLIIKPMVAGGYYQTRSIIKTARKKNIRTVITSSLESYIGRLALLHMASAFEITEYCGLLTGCFLDEPDHLQMKAVSSCLSVPDKFGLGAEHVW